MPMDDHEPTRQMIDKTLVGMATPQEEQALRGHLADCATCRQYLDTSQRVIAGLGGFSFPVAADLHGKVIASLALRAQQLEMKRSDRRPLGWSLSMALLLTLAGSFTAARFGGLAAAVYHLQAAPLHFGLVAFWIMPSVCVCLLLPILHRWSASWMNEKGLSHEGR
jgi:hypothetical protein